MKVINLIICIIISSFSYAQTISPQVLAIAGETSNPQLVWTLGEVATETLISTNQELILTQGFHQPEGGNMPTAKGRASSPQKKKDAYKTIKETPYESLTFNLFPNPAEREVQLNLKDFVGKSIDIALYNSLGQEVHFLKIPEVRETIKPIKLEGFSHGIHFVTVKYKGKVYSKKLMVSKLE